MEGFNPQLMEKEEAIKSIEQKFRDVKVSIRLNMTFDIDLYYVKVNLNDTFDNFG